MKIKKIILSIIISVAIATMLTACGSEQPEIINISLKLNWKHSANFIGFYAAQSQGFYADEGLKVTVEELSEPSLADQVPFQVLNGDYEIGIGASDLARAQLEGLELTAISNIMKRSPAAFFARKDSGIKTPADFLGHSVVVKSLIWQELLAGLLEYADLSLEDIEIYNGSFDMTPFFEEKVDVWAGFITEEVVQARLKGIELVTFPLYEYGRTGSSVILFTSHNFLAANQDILIRFLRASIKGWQFAIDNPSVAVNQMLASYPELSEGFDFYLASFVAAIPLIIPSGSLLGDINCNNWNARDGFENLESAEFLCTRDIFLAAMSEKNIQLTYKFPYTHHVQD